MKKKVKKIESAKNISDRISGIGTFRITGPHPETGERLTVEYYGTREQAENIDLFAYYQSEQLEKEIQR